MKVLGTHSDLIILRHSIEELKKQIHKLECSFSLHSNEVDITEMKQSRHNIYSHVQNVIEVSKRIDKETR
jgi:archaellum component FlaC